MTLLSPKSLISPRGWMTVWPCAAVGLIALGSCSHSGPEEKSAPEPASASTMRPPVGTPGAQTGTPPTTVSSTGEKELPAPRFEVSSRPDASLQALDTPKGEPDTRKAVAPRAQKLKLLWVSLDGLKREDVLTYAATLRSPHPRGFRFLLGKGTKWTPVRVTNPSITSSSHASTITCAPPGLHGILDNGQWNGESMESGFDKPYTTETFVAALRKSGKRVGVLGYPGFDAKTDNRTADFAVAYDNSPVKPQFLALNEAAPLPFVLESRVETGLKFSASARFDARENTATVDLGPSGRHTVGVSGWTDVAFVERDVRQLVSMRLFLKAPQPGAATSQPSPVLYVSSTMRNNASPEAFRKSLDAKGLVFSPGKSYRVRAEFGDQAFLRTMEHRLAYFKDAGREMLARDDADAFFLYLEDLDVLGHQYAGDAKADALRAEHFAKVDKALGQLLSLVPESANVLLVGDHGMSAVDYELAANALLPETARGKFVVKASGGSLFLYGTDKSSLTSPAPTEEPWFKDTVKALSEWRVPTNAKKALFPKVVVKGSALAKTEGWTEGVPLPWIAAFATPGIGIKETTETALLVSVRKGTSLPPELRAQAAGGDASKLGEPVPYGQHGHDADAAEMLTNVVTFGPQFNRNAGRLGARTTNLKLVPFVADALGWPRPSACARARP